MLGTAGVAVGAGTAAGRPMPMMLNRSGHIAKCAQSASVIVNV